VSAPQAPSDPGSRRGSGLDRVAVTRYVTPLREGGSLPGLVEGEDLGTYVCKFRGAGQGLRVLVAEVVVAELARALDLRTPQQVVLDLGPDLARYEADEEVQDLLVASVGTNLGVDFLPGAFGYEPTDPSPLPEAAPVVWLDALCANVDRSWRNPNLLRWGDGLHLIDHGAALYFHHGWSSGVGDPERFAAQPWDASDHVLLDRVVDLGATDERLTAALTPHVIRGAVDAVPEPWLEPIPGAEDPTALRAAYVAFLTARLGTRQWLPEVRR